MAMNESDLFPKLEYLAETKGSINISHNKGGGGMGLYWCASINNEWPYCHGGTIKGALSTLVSEHLRLEREENQKRINDIDASANL